MAATTKVSEAALTRFTDIKQAKYRYVMWEIKNNEIVPAECGDKKSNYEDFIDDLPGHRCRFAVYDHQFLANGNRPTGKLRLIFWTPLNANQVDRVIYTQALNPFRNQLPGTMYFAASETEQIEELLQDESIPK